MFNDDAFSKIKKGARIINVARGGVIDDHALARAIDAGQVAQVILTPEKFQCLTSPQVAHYLDCHCIPGN